MAIRSISMTPVLTPIVAQPVPLSDFYGTNGNDDLTGNDGSNWLYGYAGNDYLFGLAGNDNLDGGTGADVMVGGTGDDKYYVDSINDVVWEWGGQGYDVVFATLSNVTYTLPAAVEQLRLLGNAACDAYGNELDNIIGANDAANMLDGGAGNDRLYANGGDDRLFGGDGNDELDGGIGNDFMQGGLGDDIYYVDSVGDVVYEAAGAGTDTIRGIGMTMPENVENFELGGGSPTNYVYGNALSNVITGNVYDNVIAGGGGYDTMYGGGGADTFKFTSLSDAPAPGFRSDYLADFSCAQGDRIDLSAIDANAFAAGDQAFLFIGNNNAFVESWGAGQLRFNDGYLQGDVDGDMVADFYIRVNATELPPDAFIL